MYLLRQNPTLLERLADPSVKAAVGRIRTLLADSSRGVVFDPVPHTYRIAGTEVPSVSSVVGRFHVFDDRAKAQQCSLNPRHPLYGHTPEEILSVWHDKRDRAAADGTAVHAFGEACFLYMCGRQDEIEEAFRDRITPEGLAAEKPKEESLARWWADCDWTRYVPVAKETVVYNPVLRYAGTFDLLLLDIPAGTALIKDYKTNEDLNRWFGDWLLPPLDCIKSNDEGKYTVQQNLYDIQVRNIGVPTGEPALIWLREDGYQEVPIPTRYQKLIAFALKKTNT